MTPLAGEHGYVGLLAQAAPGLSVEGRLGAIGHGANDYRPSAGSGGAAGSGGGSLAVRRSAALGDGGIGGGMGAAASQRRGPAASAKPQGTRDAPGGDRRRFYRLAKALVGKQLPADTRMIDLTRERNDDLEPDAEPGDGKPLGHGVHMALAVLRAAPEVELTLVRIDPAAPYMLQQVARAMNGDADFLRQPAQPPGQPGRQQFPTRPGVGSLFCKNASRF